MNQLLQVRRLFEELVELPSDSRETRLSSIRVESPELAAEVEGLLRQDELGVGLPSRAPIEAFAGSLPSASLLVGRELAGYRILRVLASGGMGTVFEAQQDRPQRRVALKTLRVDTGSSDAIRRFKIEVEVLGRLQHRGIAQIFDAGTLELDGVHLPYLTMELVPDALPIVQFARERRLDERARLDLFVEACEAVHHGHSKGILHRDLKAGNVLVDGSGRAKLIDFGLARALDPTSIDVTEVPTREGDVLGTLSTMSPEHLSGRPYEIDTRSDVYSLGCILFELLVGEPPVDLRGLSLPAAMRKLADATPVVPERVPRDLRWVLLKALDRDPERRYATVRELAADLDRYRRRVPVVAAEPSTLYQLTRFTQRNRALLTALAAVLLALLLGLAKASVEAGRARRARDEAQRQAFMAGGVSEFLMNLFVSLNAFADGADAKVRDQLIGGEGRLEHIEDESLRAVLQGLIGEGFLNLQELDRAEAHILAAVELAERNLPETARERLHIEVLRVHLLDDRGEPLEARAFGVELLERIERALGPAHRDARYIRTSLGSIHTDLAEYEEALALHRRTLEHLLAEERAGNVELGLRQRVASALSRLDRHEEADAEFERALELAIDDGRELFQTGIRMDYGGSLWKRGRLAEAAEHFERCEQEFERFGGSLQNRFAIAINIANVAMEMEDHERAEERLDPARELAEQLEGERGPFLVAVDSLAARLAVLRADHEIARILAEEGLLHSREVFGPGNRYVYELGMALSTACEQSGDVEAAAGALRELRAEFSDVHGPDHHDGVSFCAELAALLARAGRVDEALPFAEEALERTSPENEATFEERRELVEELRALSAGAGEGQGE